MPQTRVWVNALRHWATILTNLIKNRKKIHGETMRLLKPYLHLVQVRPGLLQAQSRKYLTRAYAKFRRNRLTVSVI
jgi:hypothetical protein